MNSRFSVAVRRFSIARHSRRSHTARARQWLIALTLVLLVAGSGRSMAQPAPDLSNALAGFTTDSYSDTEAAIIAVTASGSAQATAIIQALQDQRLLVSKSSRRVLIRQPAGTLSEAATGTPAAGAPTDLAPVRLNNRVRRAASSALGALTLMAPEPGQRIAAAQAVFASRDETVLPALDAALAKEQLEAPRKALKEARAAVILAQQTAAEAEQIDAVAIIRARGDREAMAVLNSVPPNASARVRELRDAAVSSIETRLAAWGTVQNAWYGLSLGSVLLLAAVGLAITFGVMGVINMAHGEMVMLGAYTTFAVQEAIRQKAISLFVPGTDIGVRMALPFDVSLNWSLPIALPLAFIFAGGVGIAIERLVIRFLYGRPLETLLATWGISLILQQAVRTTFGANNREVSAPSWMSGAFEVGYLTITYGRLWIVCFTAAVFASLLALLRYSRIGLEMRAVTQNRRMAAAMGIRTARIDALTFGLGSGIAGIAGVALSQIDNVGPNLGQNYIIDSFLVVVFGGVGNLWGTLVGALSLGLANKFLEPIAGAMLGKIVLLVLIILFIQKRPRGLFALKGRAIEA